MASLISLLTFLLLQSTFLYTNGQKSKKFFRKDYTYIPESESFYKIHTIHRTWSDAKRRCALEGASLFYPEDATETNTVITFWNQTQPYFHWVFIGVSDLIAKGVFETIDGRPISEVYESWGPGEPNDQDGLEGCVILRREGSLNDDRCDKKYPFICKKELTSLEWNQNCDMPNLDYVYDDELGRCYKFHLDPKNWTEAFAVCSAEQSYLAIVNSEVEVDYLVTLTAEAPTDDIQGNHLKGVVHLGFHNRDDEGWKTIRGGTSLADSGYTSWAIDRPSGGVEEQCGSMLYNGQLNDLNCDLRCFYICEHDISSLTESQMERFSVDK